MLNRAVSSSIPTEQGDWPVNNVAAQMQARMQHQQGNGQQQPAPLMGHYSGAGSMPFFGKCSPSFLKKDCITHSSIIEAKCMESQFRSLTEVYAASTQSPSKLPGVSIS